MSQIHLFITFIYYILKQLVCYCFHLNDYKYCTPLPVLHIHTNVVKSRVFLRIHSRGVLELTCKINTWPTSNLSLFFCPFLKVSFYPLKKNTSLVAALKFNFSLFSPFLFKGNCTFAGKQPSSSWPLWILLQGIRAALFSKISWLCMNVVLWAGGFFSLTSYLLPRLSSVFGQ